MCVPCSNSWQAHICMHLPVPLHAYLINMCMPQHEEVNMHTCTNRTSHCHNDHTHTPHAHARTHTPYPRGSVIIPGHTIYVCNRTCLYNILYVIMYNVTLHQITSILLVCALLQRVYIVSQHISQDTSRVKKPGTFRTCTRWQRWASSDTSGECGHVHYMHHTSRLQEQQVGV